MSKVTNEFINKMEQWAIVMALMGQTRDQIEEDENWDDHGLIETIGVLMDIEERKRDPGDKIHAALRSLEMDVSVSEIYSYYDHLNKIDQEREKAEREREVQDNPALVKLRNKHDFVFITDSKQYPKHCHFKFKIPGGTEVRGRIFRHSWRELRIWLTWKDKQGKPHKNLTTCYDGREFTYPGSFPRQWFNDHAKTAKQLAQIIAWKQIHNSKLPTGMERISSVVKTQQKTVDQ